ncbi:hypothetical protein [Streptomyces fumanus]|uniref:hypothetical protein n=1 Tax=Streptomyces fumanus TaxID=67302 RepID=UPI00167D7B88|nr:hypothetical protein [Streptomyces fumanus]
MDPQDGTDQRPGDLARLLAAVGALLERYEPGELEIVAREERERAEFEAYGQGWRDAVTQYRSLIELATAVGGLGDGTGSGRTPGQAAVIPFRRRERTPPGRDDQGSRADPPRAPRVDRPAPQDVHGTGPASGAAPGPGGTAEAGDAARAGATTDAEDATEAGATTEAGDAAEAGATGGTAVRHAEVASSAGRRAPDEPEETVPHDPAESGPGTAGTGSPAGPGAAHPDTAGPETAGPETAGPETAERGEDRTRSGEPPVFTPKNPRSRTPTIPRLARQHRPGRPGEE